MLMKTIYHKETGKPYTGYPIDCIAILKFKEYEDRGDKRKATNDIDPESVGKEKEIRGVLIVKAEALGIEGSKSMTVDQLKESIEVRKAEEEEFAEDKTSGEKVDDDNSTVDDDAKDADDTTE